MIILLSPAKTLDYDASVGNVPFTVPSLLPKSKQLIKILKSRCRSNEFLKPKTNCDIMYYTGPDMFTTAYHTYPKKNEIYVYSQSEYKNILDWGKKGDWGL